MRKKSVVAKNLSAYSVVVCAVLFLFVVSLLTPMLWGMITSLKSWEDFMFNVSGLPAKWTFSNYTTAINEFIVRVRVEGGYKDVAIPMMYLNTIIYAGTGALASTVVPCIAGYCTARFPYKFSKIITAVILFAMIMPIVGSLPSEIQMSQMFGLYDNIWLIWVMRANFHGIYFLIFQATFRGVPKEFAEAAKIDGASNMSIFIRIMLPLVRNAFLTVLLIMFVGIWNEYQTALIYIPSHPTIAYGVYLFNFSQSGATSHVPMKITGAMLVLIPILTVFILFHNRLMGNITMGGIKG